MTFQTIPVNLVGGAYPTRSRFVSSQRLLNLYPEAVPSGQHPAVLYSWPGAKQWSTDGTGADRGMHTHKKTGVLYQVRGNNFYEISDAGVSTSKGTVTGTGPVVMDDDGTNIFIATGSFAYYYDGTTLNTITDPSYEEGPSVAAVNLQAVWQGAGDAFLASDVSLPNSINDSNRGQATSLGDSLTRVHLFSEILYLMGGKNIEPWDNTGVGSPPFSRIKGGIIDVGLISTYAVCHNENFMYWISNTKCLYRTTQYNAENMTPPGIAETFKNYDMTNCKLYRIFMDGQNFILMIFPSASKTWVYSESTNFWIELAYKASEEQHLVNSYTFAYGKHLIASRVDGRVYEWDPDTTTDNGEIIARERILPPITAGSLKVPGARLQMDRFEVIMQKGVGTATGQGEDPVAQISFSYDGGASYADEAWPKIGRTGEARGKVETYNSKVFGDLTVKVRVTDPVFTAMTSAAIDVTEAGW